MKKALASRGPGRPRERMLDKHLGKSVLKLHSKGLSYSQIGELLDISKQRAHQVYTRMQRELTEGKGAS
jgi:hypothetical protein